MTFQASLAPADLLERLVSERFASRLWRKDVTLFAAPNTPAEERQAIEQRLGWLEAAIAAEKDIPTLTRFADEAHAAGLTDVYLLGMGGSSLCAEVLRDTGAAASNGTRFVVLDTTDERAIGEVTAAVRPEASLFLVASKSGSTIEVTSLERHFWAAMSRAGIGEVGAHFVAITDPGTPLVALSAARNYRQVFLNPADIGGRYSALSRFGLVPAALLGHDLPSMAAAAQRMAEECRADSSANPGLSLGAFMAGHARAGRDKLTIAASTGLASLGAWIEQLVAESTGKKGEGVLPVVTEPRGDVADYGDDRAFVAVRTSDDESLVHWQRRLEAAGHPVFAIETSAEHLGAEFVRWEVATAIAGAALGVNPFDEPDVRAAKTFTSRQLDAFQSDGALRVDPPLRADRPGCRVRTHTGNGARSAGRYLAILDYLPVNSARGTAMTALSADLRETTRLAVTHGIGPRYLHSTGQYHKGGPNAGLFVLVTSDDATITLIPDASYSFSVLKHAQALGDFDALAAAGRDVIHVHFENPEADAVSVLREAIVAWLR